MYSEGYTLNALFNGGFREKASTCKYASSSSHIKSHAGRSVSMGFPCLGINFMNFLKYGFSNNITLNCLSFRGGRHANVLTSVTPAAVCFGSGFPYSSQTAWATRMLITHVDLNGVK